MGVRNHWKPGGIVRTPNLFRELYVACRGREKQAGQTMKAFVCQDTGLRSPRRVLSREKREVANLGSFRPWSIQ